ncbi:MAG: hypothetical protein LC620_07750, partial [Halobacteriales archaeon]|nr:hypothetical protein [Halobacteriales archaeon]
AAWDDVKAALDNFTYEVDTGSPRDVVLVTSPHLGPAVGSDVVTTGPVVLRAPHPDGSGRTLVVVLARDLESPILFR